MAKIVQIQVLSLLVYGICPIEIVLDWDPHFFLELVRPWKNAGQVVGTYLNYESAKALVLINGIY